MARHQGYGKESGNGLLKTFLKLTGFGYDWTIYGKEVKYNGDFVEKRNGCSPSPLFCPPVPPVPNTQSYSRFWLKGELKKAMKGKFLFGRGDYDGSGSLEGVWWENRILF